MYYSLICPTRQRQAKVGKFLKSVNETVSDKNDVEILFIVDDNDMATKAYVVDYITQYTDLHISFHERKRTEFLNKDYYNYGCSLSKGEFCWIVGDDITFLIPEWDKSIKIAVEYTLSFLKDRVLCVSIKDNTPKPSHELPQFPCFPLFSKEAIQVLGYALHPQVPTWGADYLNYQLYHDKRVDRLFEIREQVYLAHESYHVTKNHADEDAIGKRIGNIFNKTKGMPQYNVRNIEQTLLPKDIEKLSNYIKEKNKK